MPMCDIHNTTWHFSGHDLRILEGIDSSLVDGNHCPIGFFSRVKLAARSCSSEGDQIDTGVLEKHGL